MGGPLSNLSWGGWITVNFPPLDATNIHSGRITTPGSVRQLVVLILICSTLWSVNTLTNCQGKHFLQRCVEEMCISQAVELSLCCLGTEAFDAFKAWVKTSAQPASALWDKLLRPSLPPVQLDLETPVSASFTTSCSATWPWTASATWPWVLQIPLPLFFEDFHFGLILGVSLEGNTSPI